MNKWEKLTYSGSECNNYLYFVFSADFFNPERITEVLNIQPTSTRVKKEPAPKRTSWKYKITAGTNIDLEKHIDELIDIFEPKIDQINQLKKEMSLETQLQFVIDIDIDPEASTPYFPLDSRAIHFLSKTDTTVDFDLYKADTRGLLNDPDE